MLRHVSLFLVTADSSAATAGVLSPDRSCTIKFHCQRWSWRRKLGRHWPRSQNSRHSLSRPCLWSSVRNRGNIIPSSGRHVQTFHEDLLADSNWFQSCERADGLFGDDPHEWVHEFFFRFVAFSWWLATFNARHLEQKLDRNWKPSATQKLVLDLKSFC